jgi:holliday junction DNA helicase RuvA
VIERLKGVVAAVSGEAVVVDVGGVGFHADVSGVTMRDIPRVGEDVLLFTHLHMREDALQLFGFSTQEERELFRMFIGVSKIGPKLALAALGSRRPAELKRAVAAGDVALFASVPGIGKKTAERIILELKEKVGELAGLQPGAAGGREPLSDDGAVPLARAALVELGYTQNEADRLLAGMDPDLPVEALVRQALARRP